LDEEEHKGQCRQQSENDNPQSAPAQFELLDRSGSRLDRLLSISSLCHQTQINALDGRTITRN
jgi:hypothetical protein